MLEFSLMVLSAPSPCHYTCANVICIKL